MIIIKKYRNRRLYNSTHSCYIRLPEIQQMVQNGEHIQVLSHPEGEDLTKQFLFELALDKTRLLEVFTNSWLENLIQGAGSLYEVELLKKLSRGLSDEREPIEDVNEVEEENSDSENIETEGHEKTEIIEYVEELSKGIPIQLKPDDLLELGWEEHSDTEEVEQTEASFQEWEDQTAERIEESFEKTAEKIEVISQIVEEDEKLINFIDHSVEDREEEQASEEEVVEQIEVVKEKDENKAKENIPVFSQQKDEVMERKEPEVEKKKELAQTKEEAPKENIISQKEILQAKLAALKAKLQT